MHSISARVQYHYFQFHNYHYTIEHIAFLQSSHVRIANFETSLEKTVLPNKICLKAPLCTSLLILLQALGQPTSIFGSPYFFSLFSYMMASMKYVISNSGTLDVQEPLNTYSHIYTSVSPTKKNPVFPFYWLKCIGII